MENMEKIIYSTFCILIKPRKFGLVIFFQKCVVWDIVSLAKNSKYGKGDEKDKVAISRLLQFFTRALD
jgi:hypothetical protein